MEVNKMARKTRALTAAEQARYDGLRKRAEKDFPPKQRQQSMSPPGIPTQIREARESQGLTWYAVAKAAGIPKFWNDPRYRSRPRRETIEHRSHRKCPRVEARAVARCESLTAVLAERLRRWRRARVSQWRVLSLANAPLQPKVERPPVSARLILVLSQTR